MRSFEDWNGDTARRAEEILGYTFSDKALLKQCFTHKSFASERGEADNERLEFLGDAVLQLAVSEALFLRENKSEGSMTEARKRYVSREALTEAAQRAEILQFLRYAGGEDAIVGKTPSNLFEAVVGGIYLDGGMNAVRKFLKRFLTERALGDYKSALQEYVQKRVNKQPEYHTRETQNGFECVVRALGREAEGFGQSKKLAQSAAAEKLLRAIEERKQ